MQARPPHRPRNIDDESRRGPRRRSRRSQQRNDYVAATAMQEPWYAEHEQRAEQNECNDQPSLRGRKRVQIHPSSVTREASRLRAGFLTDDEIDELARDDDRLAHFCAVDVRLHSR